MKSETVNDPEGRRWRVSVRMLPWRPRFRWPWTLGRGRKKPAETQSTGSFDPSPAADILFFDEVIFVALIALVALALLPTFIFVIEVLILAVVLTVTVLIRVLFRQPWIVDAVADDGTRTAWKVHGYRASRRAVSDIAEQLARGTTTPLARGAALVR